MKRTVIKIDEKICNGCGQCVTGCNEGALQLINGKAVMISELYCDGLGACIGECPVGAIELEEREAKPYDEEAVMERIAPKGEKTIIAHLKHLKEHNENALLMQGIDFLRRNSIDIDLSQLKYNKAKEEKNKLPSGCPSSMAKTIQPKSPTKQNADIHIDEFAVSKQKSELRQWPVQLHLVNPNNSYFEGADVLLAADCSAFATANFHTHFLKGKILAIACPKLDNHADVYLEKITTMIDESQINTLSVLIMEVPCCAGLLRMAKAAREKAKRNVPIKAIILTLEGEIKSAVWI